MKRGIKWRPIAVGRDRLDADSHCHGIPVRFDPTAQLAQAHGFGPRRGWIGVGQAWFSLPAREQQAVLLHEEAHLRSHHLVWRLLALPFCVTRFGKNLAARQELAADFFAARHGFGVELLRIVRHFPQGRFYPDQHERISHLQSAIRALMA